VLSFLTRPHRPRLDDGHPHRCRQDHHWQHRGPSARTCRLRAPDVESADCPFCRPGEASVRDVHSHRCPECRGDWAHAGLCRDGRWAWCPACSPETDPGSAAAHGRGPHVHSCRACGQDWPHAAPCAAPLRVTLPECPGCRRRQVKTAVGPGETRGAARLPHRRGRLARIGPVTASILVLSGSILVGSASVDREPGAQRRAAAPRSPSTPAAGVSAGVAAGAGPGRPGPTEARETPPVRTVSTEAAPAGAPTALLGRAVHGSVRAASASAARVKPPELAGRGRTPPGARDRRLPKTDPTAPMWWRQGFAVQGNGHDGR
jgi:hypothetical protein